MCDYSLHCVTSREARKGDRLVTTVFAGTITRGFAAPAEPNVAVCVSAGTELAFDSPVQVDRVVSFFGRQRLSYATARFCKINVNDPHAHHDALEFPNGKIVLVTRLSAGQHATVLQLPAGERSHEPTPSRPESEISA
jgi:hypothetical protein